MSSHIMVTCLIKLYRHMFSACIDASMKDVGRSQKWSCSHVANRYTKSSDSLRTYVDLLSWRAETICSTNKHWTAPTPTNAHAHPTLWWCVHDWHPFWGCLTGRYDKKKHVFTSEAPETQHLGSVEPSSSWDHWICSHQSIFRLGNPTVCTGVYFEQYFNCRIMSNFSRFSPSLTEIIYRLVWCIPWSFIILSSELGWVKGARKLGEGKSIQSISKTWIPIVWEKPSCKTIKKNKFENNLQLLTTEHTDFTLCFLWRCSFGTHKTLDGHPAFFPGTPCHLYSSHQFNWNANLPVIWPWTIQHFSMSWTWQMSIVMFAYSRFRHTVLTDVPTHSQ